MRTHALVSIVLLSAGVFLLPTVLHASSSPDQQHETQLEKRFGGFFEASDRQHISWELDGSEDAHTAEWNDDVQDVNYVVDVDAVFKTGAGQCREFFVRAEINGRHMQARGTACLKKGNWRIVE